MKFISRIAVSLWWFTLLPPIQAGPIPALNFLAIGDSGSGTRMQKDVAEAMREVRVALLEADVALPVVKDFIAFATEKATGEAVIAPKWLR